MARSERIPAAFARYVERERRAQRFVPEVRPLMARLTPGAVLAWDDDRGRGGNARIVRKLQPGSYWLSVRHKTPTGTGSYGVAVIKRRR